MHKKLGSVMIVALLILSLTIVGCSSPKPAATAPEAEPIRIGVIGPMTGWASFKPWLRIMMQ